MRDFRDAGRVEDGVDSAAISHCSERFGDDGRLGPEQPKSVGAFDHRPAAFGGEVRRDEHSLHLRHRILSLAATEAEEDLLSQRRISNRSAAEKRSRSCSGKEKAAAKLSRTAFPSKSPGRSKNAAEIGGSFETQEQRKAKFFFAKFSKVARDDETEKDESTYATHVAANPDAKAVFGFGRGSVQVDEPIGDVELVASDDSSPLGIVRDQSASSDGGKSLRNGIPEPPRSTDQKNE